MLLLHHTTSHRDLTAHAGRSQGWFPTRFLTAPRWRHAKKSPVGDGKGTWAAKATHFCHYTADSRKIRVCGCREEGRPFISIPKSTTLYGLRVLKLASRFPKSLMTLSG